MKEYYSCNALLLKKGDVMSEDKKSILVGIGLIVISIIIVVSFTVLFGEKNEDKSGVVLSDSDIETIDGFNRSVVELIEKQNDYKTTMDIYDYDNKIKEVINMHDKLTAEQKAEIDGDKYNLLMSIHNMLGIKLSTVRLQQAYIDSLNAIVEIFDESMADNEYVKKAENIANLYDLLKNDSKEMLLDKDKTQRIVTKYKELKSKEEQTEISKKGKKKDKVEEKTTRKKVKETSESTTRKQRNVEPDDYDNGEDFADDAWGDDYDDWDDAYEDWEDEGW
ncbi:hypothetical protein [Eubacterium uniforme]|uniref:Uncharacterized protein n=1 Tax=Eubacterium uniforme TaxID=39495 RepID=A0A1T4VXP7_9FIRM|nr:hypothetical protein [Eubacterium uniforme]SKA69605.1 hypothetical protein SAMN02745111_01899 [Eubacterium uniforme]HAV91451.1 hypothetical protein [Eubacterium sp.]